jgi:Txe/YoeB family toxin of Txe-Axe toxin-antitoxin module
MMSPGYGGEKGGWLRAAPPQALVVLVGDRVKQGLMAAGKLAVLSREASGRWSRRVKLQSRIF